MPSTPQNYIVDKITASQEGSFLALSGSRGVAILELPRRFGPNGTFSEGRDKIICRFVMLWTSFIMQTYCEYYSEKSGLNIWCFVINLKVDIMYTEYFSFNVQCFYHGISERVKNITNILINHVFISIFRSHNLDDRFFTNNIQLEVLQVRWHPASPKDSHLLVLLSNNSIR